MKSIKLTSILIGLGLITGVSRSQTAEPAAPAAVPTPSTEATVTAAPAVDATAIPHPEAAKKVETLSVDFPDDDIRSILRNVADLFELNLVIPDTLQGKTSIKLRDVTWRQIFKVVLNPVGYTYVEEGNIIRVVTTDSLNLEPAVTEVFILNYAKASDVKPSIDPLVESKAGGRIVVDARSNALIVTERPSSLNRIRPIITTLDKATDQVMIETKFIDVTDGDQKNIGVNWTSLQGYGIGTEGATTRTITDTRNRNDSNSIGNTGANSTNFGNSSTNTLGEKNLDITHMTESKNKLDSLTGTNTSPVPFTRRDDGNGGKEVVFDAGGSSQLTRTFTDGTSGSTGSTSSSALSYVNGLAGTTTTVLSADEFRLVLSALTTTNRSKLVSNPTVVTLNNTEATINIGSEYPIPNYTYNQERGVFEVSGFNYKPIGVLMKVTPQVNSAGFIRLTVEPEVSSSNESVSFGGSGGASIPVIQVRKTKTQITLKDGFTLGIGGLIRKTSQRTDTKVPLLGDIPGLGRLFRSKSDSTSDQNLLIFITAKTVKPDGAGVGEIFDPRATRAMQLTKDDLPGSRDGSDPFYTPPPAPEKGKKKSKDKDKKE